MNFNVVELDNVSLTYHEPHAETHALKNLNLTVSRGEFTAIVGPSGCGKTSMLSLLAGIIRPSEGSVYVLGKEADGPNERVGYMLQRDHLLDWRTIEGNIMLGLEVKKKKNAQTAAHAMNLLDRYGLYDFRNHYPRQLSGGMRQKVALIRTLAFDPEILLLDEPFSALDYQTRLIISEEVHGIIREENKTALLVTHDIAEAISMSDRVVVFSHRPAKVKREYMIDLPCSPFARRNKVQFQEYFNSIWKELHNDDSGQS